MGRAEIRGTVRPTPRALSEALGEPQAVADGKHHSARHGDAVSDGGRRETSGAQLA